MVVDMSSGSSAHRPIPSEDTIREWFQTLSNWNRWGPDDRLGTLNHITDDKRAAAAQTVRVGTSVSCAWDIDMEPMEGAHVAPQRWMYRTGLGFSDEPAPRPPRMRDGCMGTASEFISMVFHGRTITHLDALSHVFWEGRMYNGLPSSFVTDRDGATVYDVRTASTGIHSRGVLLDIARVRGVDALEPGESVFPEDLDAAEAAQGVRVGAGDVLIVRTGDGRLRREKRWQPSARGQAGLHAACLPWLYERSVAVLASDGPQDVNPSGYPGIYLPVHAVAIVAMGMWLVDNCQLEDLAQTCDRLSRWEFMFTINPLRLTGVTGGPVNPVALF
jgi:kynurenine formamidase